MILVFSRIVLRPCSLFYCCSLELRSGCCERFLGRQLIFLGLQTCFKIWFSLAEVMSSWTPREWNEICLQMLIQHARFVCMGEITSPYSNEPSPWHEILTAIRKLDLFRSGFKSTCFWTWQSWDLILLWKFWGQCCSGTDFWRFAQNLGAFCTNGSLVLLHIFFYHVTVVKIPGKIMLLNSREKCHIPLFAASPVENESWIVQLG